MERPFFVTVTYPEKYFPRFDRLIEAIATANNTEIGDTGMFLDIYNRSQRELDFEFLTKQEARAFRKAINNSGLHKVSCSKVEEYPENICTEEFVFTTFEELQKQ